MKKDFLLEKFFEQERWEKALDIGCDKSIDKGLLRALTQPETRLYIFNKIVNGEYEIAPPKQVAIPKDNGEYRIVYVNEGLDRIVLSIINSLLFEFCHELIHSNCKSYQTGIGCGKIVQQATKEIEKVKSDDIGVKLDLTKYFDSVAIEYIDNIFDKVEEIVGKSKVIDICRKYYHADECYDTDGNLVLKYQSLKQGCAVASFLANAVLYNIDLKVSNLSDIFYVRYSDDLLIIGNHWEEGFNIVKKDLGEMRLSLNPKKVEYLSRDKWFKFLGFRIKGSSITISKNRVKDFQKNIEECTIRNKDISYKRALNRVNRYLYKGDGQYSWATSVLPIINVSKDITALNGFVMDSLRACQTNKKRIGGLGSADNLSDRTIMRGTGRNVKSNREKTEKRLKGYYTLNCMRNALLTRRAVYDTLVRSL